MKIRNEIERDAQLTNVEKAALGLFALWPLLAILAIGALCNGCVYKGGKVIDGTNLAIGMKIPGTEWSISILDYIGGVRVAGQDSTHITVKHEVAETNTYTGVVTTSRRSTLTADIEPLADCVADSKLAEESE